MLPNAEQQQQGALGDFETKEMLEATGGGMGRYGTSLFIGAPDYRGADHAKSIVAAPGSQCHASSRPYGSKLISLDSPYCCSAYLIARPRAFRPEKIATSLRL